jgi:hypothetical protein
MILNIVEHKIVQMQIIVYFFYSKLNLLESEIQMW